MKTYTLRDLDLGFVKLTEEAKQVIAERAVPILAGVTIRLLAEEQAREAGAQAAASK